MKQKRKIFFPIGKRIIKSGDPIFIIAELANCHNGDFNTAKRMIDEISDVGVDAVKFQLHIVEEEMISSHPKFHTQKERSLSVEELSQLKKYVESKGLVFLCTPFSMKAADELESMGVDVFKIGSGEITNLPFIEHVAKKRKPMIVSTGMSSLKEISETVELIKSIGVPLMLLYTVSIYPTPYERLNLGVIPKLRRMFSVPVGLSDHTPEIFSAIASVPYGALVIEKHYTLDRKQPGTSDHKVSLEPHEFRMLVDGIRKIERACGSLKDISHEEKKTIEWARHGIVTVVSIPKDASITAQMVSTKRPLANGIPAKELSRIIGRRTKRALPKDYLILREDIF